MHALTMKTLGDAIVVRNRVIDALGVADNQTDDADRKVTLTVVVAGGGFAGVETAGAVNDLLREAKKFYPNLKKASVRVVVVDPGEVILPELSASLGRYAQKKLVERGVEIRSKTKVTAYDGKEVTLNDGTKIATRMLIWTAGITPPQLLSTLPCASSAAAFSRTNSSKCPNVPAFGHWAIARSCPMSSILASSIHPPRSTPSAKPKSWRTTSRRLCVASPCSPSSSKSSDCSPRLDGAGAWRRFSAGGSRESSPGGSGGAIYLSKLPGVQKKIRVALDWTLDLIFTKDIVQLPILRAPTTSHAEESSTDATSEHGIPVR